MGRRHCAEHANPSDIDTYKYIYIAIHITNKLRWKQSGGKIGVFVPTSFEIPYSVFLLFLVV